MAAEAECEVRHLSDSLLRACSREPGRGRHRASHDHLAPGRPLTVTLHFHKLGGNRVPGPSVCVCVGGVPGGHPAADSRDPSLGWGACGDPGCVRTGCTWVPWPICAHGNGSSPGDVYRGREHQRAQPHRAASCEFRSPSISAAGPRRASSRAVRSAPRPTPRAGPAPGVPTPGVPRRPPTPGPGARTLRLRSDFQPPGPAPHRRPCPPDCVPACALPRPRSPVPAPGPRTPLPAARRGPRSPERPGAGAAPRARRPRASGPSPISGAGAAGRGSPARKGGYSGPGRQEQLRPPGFPAGCVAGTEGTLGQGSLPPQRPTFFPCCAHLPPVFGQTLSREHSLVPGS